MNLIFTEIRERLEEIDRREWEMKVKQQEDATRLESERISAMKRDWKGLRFVHKSGVPSRYAAIIDYHASNLWTSMPHGAGLNLLGTGFPFGL